MWLLKYYLVLFINVINLLHLFHILPTAVKFKNLNIRWPVFFVFGLKEEIKPTSWHCVNPGWENKAFIRLTTKLKYSNSFTYLYTNTSFYLFSFKTTGI